MTDRQKKITAGVAAIFLPTLTLLIFLLRDYFIGLSKCFPECRFYRDTGWLCPACGNTRSVTALFHGDILSSLGYNITPILLFTFAAAFYIELAAYAFGAKIRIIPRSYRFLTAVLIALPLYYLFRNFIPFLTLCA